MHRLKEKQLHYHKLVHKHWPAQAARTEEEEGAARPQPVSAHAQMAWTSTPEQAQTPERGRGGETEGERKKKRREREVGQYDFFPQLRARSILLMDSLIHNARLATTFNQKTQCKCSIMLSPSKLSSSTCWICCSLVRLNGLQ